MVSFWAKPVVDDKPHCFVVNLNNYPKIIPLHLDTNFMLSNITLNFNSSCFITDKTDDYLADTYQLGVSDTSTQTDIQQIKYRYIAQFTLPKETILQRIKQLNDLQLERDYAAIGNKRAELYKVLKAHLIGIRIDELDKSTRQWDECVNNPVYESWSGSVCALL